MSDTSPDLAQYVQWCREAAKQLRRNPHICSRESTGIQARLYYDGLRLLPAELARTLPLPPLGGYADYVYLSELTNWMFGRPPQRYFDVLTALERVIEWYDAATADDSDDAPRLVVDLARRTITLDGTTYDVPSEQALRWVAVLAATPGQWYSSSDLEKADPELVSPRTSRLLGYLPGPIRDLIETAPGKGSRLRPT